MAEQQVTVAGTSHPLAPPFFVLATLNPIEMEGTYQLPEAQLDRFLFKVLLDYPSAAELERILGETTAAALPAVRPVLARETAARRVEELKHLVRQVLVAPHMERHVAALVRATVPAAGELPQAMARYVTCGPSPRASSSRRTAPTSLATTSATSTGTPSPASTRSSCAASPPSASSSSTSWSTRAPPWPCRRVTGSSRWRGSWRWRSPTSPSGRTTRCGSPSSQATARRASRRSSASAAASRARPRCSPPWHPADASGPVRRSRRTLASMRARAVRLALGSPAGALPLGAVGVLIVLPLYGRRRRAVPVGTLFLWQRVPAEPLDRRRFRPDLLFALQLVLLLALIAGLVRPYLEVATPAAERVRLLVVLDVSASMQAREEGGTRFELARRRARALVAQLLTGDEVMLVTAAQRAHVLLAWTADHARAQDRLEALEPLDTPTDLAAALELALGERRARPETQVAVLTDLPPEASGVAHEELAYVDWVQIGRSDDNVAITGLSVEAPPFHPAGDATATGPCRPGRRAPSRRSTWSRRPATRSALVCARSTTRPSSTGTWTTPPSRGSTVSRR